MKARMSREEANKIYQDLRQSVVSLLHKDPAKKSGVSNTPKTTVERLQYRSYLIWTVIFLAAGKFILTTTMLTGVIKLPDNVASTKIDSEIPRARLENDPVKRQLYDSLERRRGELERKEELLQRKYDEFNTKEETIAIRLAELRQLTEELRTARHAKEQEKNTNIEQLANVYVSMNPAEAAELMDQLDDLIVLQLLKRMPEKRQGQLLATMKKDKALHLTRLLTDK
jgi:flagellar motility protein MotE (MotC chaperone)